MIVTIGCDHGGVDLKDYIKDVIAKDFPKIEVNDVGTFGKAPVDYPDIAEKICAEIKSGHSELGIALCGTGLGMSIACNKIDGIRAALCGDVYSAIKSREHNDVNVLALGGRVMGFGTAKEIVKAWLRTPFANEERHKRRIAKAMAIEEK